MGWQPAEDPECPPDSVELVLLPRAHDIGGFEVRCALPALERQMVGPSIFFEQMGPGEFLAGRGLDVRPHPRCSACGRRRPASSGRA
jgi:redox-sensitive bicupin YhaK (pirin superfamily)